MRPDEYHDSIYEIDFALLHQKGIKYLLIDIDNTLVEHNGISVTTRLRDWFKRLIEDGFSICIVSNNKHLRVSKFSGEFTVPFVALAGKPRKSAFRKALALLGAEKHNTAVIGDQIFTDVLGGNRAGLYTLLVVPVGKHELKSTQFARMIERRLLTFFGLRGADGNRTRAL